MVQGVLVQSGTDKARSAPPEGGAGLAARLLARYAPLWPVARWLLFGIGAAYCIGQITDVLPGYDGVRGPLGVMVDAEAYYTAPLDDPYRNSVAGAQGAYLYSPAFLQAITPLRLLPEPAFMAAWTALHLAAIAWLGPWLAILPPLVDDTIRGNVNTFLALMLAVGIRHPAAWSFGVLTKLAPGMAGAWHLFRRDWRGAAIAAAVTALVVAASVALGGVEPWFAWADSLSRQSRGELLLRAPLALVLFGLAAWRWPWLLPFGALAMFGTPALSTFAPLAALPRLVRR